MLNPFLFATCVLQVGPREPKTESLGEPCQQYVEDSEHNLADGLDVVHSMAVRHCLLAQQPCSNAAKLEMQQP